MPDARFADGDGRPLRLLARDADDLGVLAALCQDAVLTGADMAWDRRSRTFGLLLGRVRREVPSDPPERVRAVLAFEDVTRVQSDGVGRGADEVLSLLDLSWEGGEDCAGVLLLTFAGDGAVRLEVEALGAQLWDVTKPYAAVSGKIPDHSD
ncbi:Protein of unknown function (DUF2948) [Hasllibacter halocynthiae]|uniref:DUF2948 family protein n=1 Tax=Hasllibacter halocynthiae TaxID=595589 RepID=A0A2T0X6S8_9RHOB|nr:DUF2948 family protein [Hasllibacter halocynthiae]PRY94627.1 Protein of unknown function (DUF2948) [Hasllibacter halocynthiae]